MDESERIQYHDKVTRPLRDPPRLLRAPSTHRGTAPRLLHAPRGTPSRATSPRSPPAPHGTAPRLLRAPSAPRGTPSRGASAHSLQHVAPRLLRSMEPPCSLLETALADSFPGLAAQLRRIDGVGLMERAPWRGSHGGALAEGVRWRGSHGGVPWRGSHGGGPTERVPCSLASLKVPSAMDDSFPGFGASDAPCHLIGR